MRVTLLLISVAILGSVYFFITDEKIMSSAKPEKTISQLSKNAEATGQPTITSNQTNPQVDINQEFPKQKNLLADGQGQKIMTALTTFWQQCRRYDNCEQLLIQQQLLLNQERYLLLLNFPDNQQEQQRLMGELLISKDTSLADKIANVQAIRTQVWGKDAKLFFEREDAYYDYRLSLTEPDNRFNQTHNADDFIEQYNQLLQEHSADLDSFSLNSDIAKYEAALQLIPENMTEEQSANIKAQLASKYLTANEQQSITSRGEQVNQQTQEITNYQQGLSQLEITLTHERATSKKTMNEQDWQIYKTERFYQFRLKFFNS